MWCCVLGFSLLERNGLKEGRFWPVVSEASSVVSWLHCFQASGETDGAEKAWQERSSSVCESRGVTGKDQRKTHPPKAWLPVPSTPIMGSLFRPWICQWIQPESGQSPLHLVLLKGLTDTRQLYWSPTLFSIQTDWQSRWTVTISEL